MVMAYLVMAYIGMAYIVMAYRVMAYTVMAYIVMVDIAMACASALALATSRVSVFVRRAWLAALTRIITLPQLL